MNGLRRILQDYPPTSTTRWFQARLDDYDRWVTVNHLVKQLDQMTCSMESFINPDAYRATYRQSATGGGMYGFKELTDG